MDTILIIEDDKDINDLIFTSLTKEGYICSQAFSGKEGAAHVKEHEPSLVLLDLMLPGISGESILAQIRAENSELPVIVISAKNSLDSKVDLLKTGADDYITKPFDLRELSARISVQLRKRHAGISGEPLKYKGFTLDKDMNCIRYEDKQASLTKQEFKILELLFSHPSKIFSKQEIYSYAWDDIYIGEEKTINVHIGNIRKKLKNIYDRDIIETVWGIGFKLI